MADAPEIAETEGLSPEARAIARKKDQIGKRFNIDPAELTAQHVLDIGDAFSARRNRLLDDNTTTLGLLTHGHLEQLVGVCSRAGEVDQNASKDALNQTTDYRGLCRRITHQPTMIE